MKVSEIKKTGCISFDAGDEVYEVASRLVEAGRKEAPVTRQGRFIGIITLSALAAPFARANVVDNPNSAAVEKAKKERIEKYVSTRMFMKIYLEPDMELSQAVAVLANRNAECVPVLDKRHRLIGGICTSELWKTIIKAVGKGRQAKKPSGAVAKSRGDDTTIDQVLAAVRARGKVTAAEVAVQLKLPLQTVEEYAQSLEKYGLLKVEYDLFGKMTLKKIE